MIDALITGKLHSKPESRTGKSGKPFVTAKLRAALADGDGTIVSVIAFAPEACRVLMALDAGDSVAVSGSATPKAWIDRDGQLRASVDIVASQAIHPEASTPQASARRYDQWEASQPHHDGFDDGGPIEL